ncbi:MAG TPA: outer membrane protein assembly factor BamB [Thiotrichales bacterium]|nr:outer membrane protein assembly factor BamB [Thiotrichales bacterium]
MGRLLLLALLLGVLSGCSAIRGIFATDTQEAPAELTELRSRLLADALWTLYVGAGEGLRAYRLAPVVEGDRVYASSANGVVAAVGLREGELFWERELERGVSAGPVVAGGLLLLGGNDGEVFALSLTDGSDVWRAKVSSLVLSPPVVAGDRVLVRTVDGFLTALDLSSGSLLWRYRSEVPSLTLRGTGVPLVTDELAIIGFDDGTLDAVDLGNGHRVWHQRVANPKGWNELERMVDVDSRPVRVGSNLYVCAYHGKVLALSVTTGEVVWSRDMSCYNDLATDGTHLYLTDEESQIWSLDLATGASLWKQDSLRARHLTAPVLMADTLVVGDLEGYLHWFATEDGSPLGREQVEEEAIAEAPTPVGDDRLVAFTTSGLMAAYRVRRLDSGKE